MERSGGHAGATVDVVALVELAGVVVGAGAGDEGALEVGAEVAAEQRRRHAEQGEADREDPLASEPRDGKDVLTENRNTIGAVGGRRGQAEKDQ